MLGFIRQTVPAQRENYEDEMACTYFNFWAAAHPEYLAFGETRPHPFVHINSYGF